MIVYKKNEFFQIIFLGLHSSKILKLFQNPAILLIAYFQKNPRN